MKMSNFLAGTRSSYVSTELIDLLPTSSSGNGPVFVVSQVLEDPRNVANGERFHNRLVYHH
jgi:hypothetical protein